MAGKYRWGRRDAMSILNSRRVQKATKQAAEAGAKAFRKKASAHRRSGTFSRNVRVERARGWDGRPGYRVTAFPGRGRHPNSPVAIEFGTSRSQGVGAMREAVKAVERGRRRLR